MAESFFDRVHKADTHVPDVLSCLANLSNDEVFTPPEVVNQMLDMLPQELFASTETTFLDPACKTGVFLREIAKRLLNFQLPFYQDKMSVINNKKENNIPLTVEDENFLIRLQKAIDHIFHKQLYGIAITELTSLLSRRSIYCSKYPNGPYSITRFDDAEGNIRFRRIQHSWKDGKCVFCKASESEYGDEKREKQLETHAYEYIHTLKPEEIWNMKFDVIISNPPYHLQDSGNGKSAKPIYHLFVEKSQKLNPRYISMVIPSRWFVGGKGLDSFRKSMLNDKRIRKLVDYENYKDIFPGLGGLAGGACYFLWDRDHPGQCEIVNKTSSTEETATRDLNEYDVFIRANKALPIIHKVQKMHKGRFLDEVVSSRKPFGLPTNYEPCNGGIPCQFIQKIGLKYANKRDVVDSFDLLDKWKLIAPKAPIAGQTDFSQAVTIYYDSNTKIIPPGTCCTESFIVLFASESKEEVEFFKTYLYTKTARFLLLMSVVSQDITKDRFRFVPDIGPYNKVYTDDYLCRLWNINDAEFDYINQRIAASGGEVNG